MSVKDILLILNPTWDSLATVNVKLTVPGLAYVVLSASADLIVKATASLLLYCTTLKLFLI